MGVVRGVAHILILTNDFIHLLVLSSGIHGLGLFSLQEIDSGDMVIEYAGTVIRSILTDYRERYYESRGIGCYMFRIDIDDVVDATMSGNMARFINHSCDVGVVWVVMVTGVCLCPVAELLQ